LANKKEGYALYIDRRQVEFRREMLSGSKTYIYAPWLVEQDCGFVFSHAKQIAISYKFPEKNVGGGLLLIFHSRYHINFRRQCWLYLITWVGIVTSPAYSFANDKFK
jgi:hypothetical protein